MDTAFSRTALLLGEDSIAKLASSRVAVFGLGGVGGYCLEALARSGVGQLDLIDNDVIDRTNINRQILALRSNIGRPKTEVAAERVMDINPAAKVRVYDLFYTDENAHLFDFAAYDYIVDAIDTVTAKVSLAVRAQECGTKIISSMGTGNKLNPSAFMVSDIYKTSVCPLARTMRNLLKKAGVKALKVVYSQEVPKQPDIQSAEKRYSGRPSPSSCAFVPSVAGLIMAGEVIKDIVSE